MATPELTYLYALAALSVSFVGFSTLLIVFRQSVGGRLTSYDTYFVLSFMEAGFIVIAGALLPPLLTFCGLPPQAAWRLASLQTALRVRRLSGMDSMGTPALQEAQVLFEMARYAAAAALFDSLAARAGAVAWVGPSSIARQRLWPLTHAATALAAAGDTSRLPRLADSVELLGRRSGFLRDVPLHFHVRGLLLEARGQTAAAATAFRKGVSSIARGYTRTNYELGRLLLADHRPADAIAMLRPALHGWFEGSNMYITRTELHELVARAFEAAGQRDSAAAHYQRVVAAWSHGDPPFRTRAAQATARLAALTRPR